MNWKEYKGSKTNVREECKGKRSTPFKASLISKLANQIIKMKLILDKMTSAIHFAKMVLLT